MFLSLLCLFIALGFIKTEEVEAGVFDNAYTFYSTYGSNMAFQPGANQEGEIYYATSAKKAVATGTKYKTVGWKVTMKNSSGSTIASLYYKLGGDNMTAVDTRIVNGYEYNLYKVTLENMRSRISEQANQSLATANCTITFDACVVLQINGVVQGGMTDSGPSWGTVYTTYNGIANAAQWSAAGKEGLKTYFNKSVEEIYYTVSIISDDGIASVSGNGKYCFGTKVSISATPDENYLFGGWSGDATSSDNPYSFVITKDVSLKANAVIDNHTSIYDGPPIIQGEDIYVSLEDARNGSVTENWLAKYVYASDIEDGEISYGIHENNSLVITNYLASDFTSFKKEGTVTETFCATDSKGNQTQKVIKVHIVDVAVYDAELIFGKIRFISKKYYRDTEGNLLPEEAGGLLKESIWRVNEGYREFLSELLY